MEKFFTKMLLMVAFVLGVTAINAQTLWPLATDSAAIRASQFADSSQIFWQKTGGATPATGFSGWITRGLTVTGAANKDNARWEWRRDASASGGKYYTGFTYLASPSRLNGAAVFNSDLLDSMGITSPHSGELVSPRMNMAGKSNFVVQINQLYRNYAAKALLSYSNDDGTTWSTPININSTIAQNAATYDPFNKANTDSTLKKIALIGSIGSANFRIKFTFDGDYYFWIVDDVKLLQGADIYDMQMTNFYAIPSSVYSPKEQADPIYFMADVKNAGSVTAKNVKLAVNVWRISDGTRVFTSTSTQYPATIRGDTTIENRILPASLNPTTLNVGKYFGSYRVLSDSSALDILPANDTVRFTFVVSDTTPALSVVPVTGAQSNYAREDVNVLTTGNLPSAYWPTPGELKTWRIGNFYRLNRGKGKSVSSIVARVNARPVIGGNLLGALYEWNDANNNASIEPTERTLVAFAEIPITAKDTVNNWWIFKLVDLNTLKPFQAKDSTNYLAMVEFDPVASNTYYPTAVFNDAYNYGPSSATWFVRDSLKQQRPYSIIIGKSSTTNWTVGGYTGVNYVPCVRLNITSYFLSDVKNILSDDNKLTIYPNPSNGIDMVTADVDLVQQSEAVISVMALDGRYMSEQVVDNLKKTQLQIDVSDYAAGMYLLKITTQNGIMTRRFVVAK
jgi:hypothetical protein